MIFRITPNPTCEVLYEKGGARRQNYHMLRFDLFVF